MLQIKTTLQPAGSTCWRRACKFTSCTQCHLTILSGKQTCRQGSYCPAQEMLLEDSLQRLTDDSGTMQLVIRMPWGYIQKTYISYSCFSCERCSVSSTVVENQWKWSRISQRPQKNSCWSQQGNAVEKLEAKAVQAAKALQTPCFASF